MKKIFHKTTGVVQQNITNYSTYFSKTLAFWQDGQLFEVLNFFFFYRFSFLAFFRHPPLKYKPSYRKTASVCEFSEQVRSYPQFDQFSGGRVGGLSTQGNELGKMKRFRPQFTDATLRSTPN